MFSLFLDMVFALPLFTITVLPFLLLLGGLGFYLVNDHLNGDKIFAKAILKQLDDLIERERLEFVVTEIGTIPWRVIQLVEKTRPGCLSTGNGGGIDLSGVYYKRALIESRPSQHQARVIFDYEERLERLKTVEVRYRAAEAEARAEAEANIQALVRAATAAVYAAFGELEYARDCMHQDAEDALASAWTEFVQSAPVETEKEDEVVYGQILPFKGRIATNKEDREDALQVAL